MAHYAFLDSNNIVTEVIVGIDETELIEGLLPEVWYGNFRNQVCKRTSYNHKIRKQYAGKGFKYNADADVFVTPQPYPSWVLDENHDWQSPTPMPSDASETKRYSWFEPNKQWIELV